MSLKTLEKDGDWKLFTKDNFLYFLTEEEMEVCNKLLNHPEAKFLTFDDGSIAIADIRRIEKMPQRIDEDHQLEGISPILANGEAEKNLKKIAEMKKKYPFLRKKRKVKISV